MRSCQKFSVLVVSAVLALGASAQDTKKASCDDASVAQSEFVADLSNIQGNVLVSDNAGIVSATNQQAIKNKVRVTTTSRASAKVSFRCDCEIQLKENERLDVDMPSTCAVILASVQAVPIGTPIGAIVPSVATTGVSTGTSALIATTVGVGAYLLYRRDRNVSPN